MKKEYNSYASFTNDIHRSGRIWTAAALGLICLVPVVFSVSSGAAPDWTLIGKTLPFMLQYLVIGLIEAFSYAPMLGCGGQYLSFVTGNISNLKLPGAMNAMTITKVKQGSEEAEIVSTISIAVSSIVTTAIILIGLIPLTIWSRQIITALAPVSPYVLPAIFGGLGIYVLSKYWKLTLIPFGIMLAITIPLMLTGVNLGMSVIMMAGMLVALITGYIMYKKKIV